MRHVRLVKSWILLFLAFAGFAAAQMTITNVTNAGSRLPRSSTSAGIAQGALFVVTGRGVGPADFQQATFPLPTTAGLGGVTVQASVGGAIVDGIMVYVAPTRWQRFSRLPPLTLGGTAVSILDSAGAKWQAPLIYVSPGKINYLIPAGVALGTAAVTIAPSSGAPQSAQIQIASVVPGLFTLNDSGLAMATVLRVSGDQQTYEDVYQVDDTGAVIARSIDLGPDTDQLSLIVSGTGFRGAGTSQTSVTINGVDAPVSFAGAQGHDGGGRSGNYGATPIPGGEQIGQTANTVKISFQ